MYFAFLFADRIAAGSSVPWASGLSFGISAEYKKGMDLALFIFLILAAAVEYAADRFARRWFQLAEQKDVLRAVLRTHYYYSLVAVSCLFAVLGLASWPIYHRLAHLILVTAVIGSIGYFFVALALFNLVVLLSANRLDRVLRSLGAALISNAAVGYVLSHLFGVEFAAVGLVVGGVVLFFSSYHLMKGVLRAPEYFYALA